MAPTWPLRPSARNRRSRAPSRSLRPGGTLSSLGVYSGKLQIPYDAFAAGIGDYRLVTTLCPGGKERMRRLMEVVRHGRVDLTPLLTHTFPLEKIADAYELVWRARRRCVEGRHQTLELFNLLFFSVRNVSSCSLWS